MMEFFNTDNLKTEEIALKLDHTCYADPVKDWVPAYYFDICLPDGTAIGKCDLRIGQPRALHRRKHRLLHRRALPRSQIRGKGVQAAFRAC